MKSGPDLFVAPFHVHCVVLSLHKKDSLRMRIGLPLRICWAFVFETIMRVGPRHHAPIKELSGLFFAVSSGFFATSSGSAIFSLFFDEEGSGLALIFATCFLGMPGFLGATGCLAMIGCFDSAGLIFLSLSAVLVARIVGFGLAMEGGLVTSIISFLRPDCLSRREKAVSSA